MIIISLPGIKKKVWPVLKVLLFCGLAGVGFALLRKLVN